MRVNISMKAASPIDFDKKDCSLVECPKCKNVNSFSVFVVTPVSIEAEHAHHFHVRCLLCDITYCINATMTEELHASKS